MSFLVINPYYLRASLLGLGVLLLVAAWLLYRSRRAGKESPVESAEPPAPEAVAGETAPQEAVADSDAGREAPAAYPIVAVRPESAGTTVARGLLVILALVVAAGFALTLLPEATVNSMARAIRLRNPVPPEQQKIAFLYLGDEIRQNEFHIRGAIRNITTQPIENLDATIRLYSPDGSLLETAIVRMETERISPDATSTFHLTIPDYKGQFSSYSVDFKLRQGEPMAYKDMRALRDRN